MKNPNIRLVDDKAEYWGHRTLLSSNSSNSPRKIRLGICELLPQLQTFALIVLHFPLNRNLGLPLTVFSGRIVNLIYISVPAPAIAW